MMMHGLVQLCSTFGVAPLNLAESSINLESLLLEDGELPLKIITQSCDCSECGGAKVVVASALVCLRRS